jgi:hypothetical protein
LLTTRPSIVLSWKNGFPSSPKNIGHAAVPISTGRPRVSAHLRSNSSPIRWGSSMTGYRAASDCRATLHALAQPLPGTGRLALQALLEQARLPTWRLWARDAAIEKKDVLKARGYAWSPGEFGRPRCWYRDVSDADRAAEVAWLTSKCDGAGWLRLGVAHHGQRSILRSLLGLGRTDKAERSCRVALITIVTLAQRSISRSL